MMRLMADECIAGTLIRLMRQSGTDIESVAETMPGSTDEAVLARSLETGRVLLTEDYDFAQLIFRFRRKAVGVIIVSPGLSEKPVCDVAAIISERLKQSERIFAGMLTILETDRTRQRAFPE
jgi:predicted nuclease of predicted toxin-antitoxin system